MRYESIPFVDKPVSRLVLGTAGRAFSSGGEVDELVETALSCGINCLDTARVYGRSEEAIGAWLRRSGRRKDVVLLTKGCHPVAGFVPRVGARQAEEDLRRSLDLLGTDHVDIYLLHRDNPLLPVGPIVEFLNKLHEEGKIGAFGGSNWTARRVAEANAYAASHGLKGFTVTSPHYSLGIQTRDPWGNGCKTITGEKNRDQRQWYAQCGMPVFAWSCLCDGVLSGKVKSDEWGGFQGSQKAYDCPENRERLRRCEELAAEKNATVAQIALSWLLCGPLKVFPIVSASSPERIRENAAAADIVLTPEEAARLAGNP